MQMQEAQNFYLRQICAASPQHVNRRVGILRTYASSPDMMRPSVRRGALHSTDHDSLQRQQDHRQQQQQSQQLESQQSQQPMMLHQQQQHQLHALCHTASAGNHPHGRVHDAADLSSLPRQQAATPFAMVSPIPEEPCCSTAGASPQHTEAHPTCLTHAGVGTTSPPSARHTASTTLDTHAGPVPASQQPNALSETRHVGSAQQTGAHYQQHCHFADETLQQSDQASSSVQVNSAPVDITAHAFRAVLCCIAGVLTRCSTIVTTVSVTESTVFACAGKDKQGPE